MKLLVGTYTTNTASEGMYQVELDEKTGLFSGVTSVLKLRDPSYLCVRNGLSYAALECSEFEGKPQGAMACARQTASGQWETLCVYGTGGSSPCHVAVADDLSVAAVANYGDGVVSVYALDQHGVPTGNIQRIQLTGKSINAQRQEGPHAHQCSFVGGALWVCDLGSDKVWKLVPGAQGYEVQGAISTPAGAGPRHMAVDPDGRTAYVVGELSNEVYVVDLQEKSLISSAGISTLPADFTGSSSCAAIRLGADRRLYASNRWHDSVAIFDLSEKTLPVLQNVVACGGKTPRDMVVVGDYILCACQDSGEVTAVVKADGTIKSKLNIPAATCILPLDE